jgi:selenocysteine lyase/cysteine desulfurase
VLIAYILTRLREIDGVHIYGETDPAKSSERVGAIPLNLDGISQFLVAAVLGYEGGIGVRAGCFCAHPYVVHLLQLAGEQAATWRAELLAGDKSNMPGMLRVSFGCYNNTDDVDRLIDMLGRIRRGEYAGDYWQERASGEYFPAGYEDRFGDYFLLER